VNDVPVPLTFVDPNDADRRWRVCLYAPAACTAPGPIVALSADRPGAYRFARHHHKTTIMEARFTGPDSLASLYAHVRENQTDIGTVILDPWNAIYDDIVREFTPTSGKPNYQRANEKAVQVIHGFRDLDVNLVLVAHERREQDENSDTEAKVYPQLGGPALVQKIMAELDIVARVFRTDEEGEPAWMGQLVTARGYQCKDSTGTLGRTREIDLTEWFGTANALLDPEADMPWAKEAA
jgi:hypothetical protein